MLYPRSRIEKAILTYYFINPEAEMHGQGLARQLKLDPSNLNKKLKSLERLGILKVKQKANSLFYKLNMANPVTALAQAIFKNSYGITDLIREAIKPVKGLKKVILFGSFAKNTYDIHSDVDLLVIGSQNVLELLGVLRPLQSQTGRVINPIQMSEKEFENRKNKDPFLKQVLSEKIIEIL